MINICATLGGNTGKPSCDVRMKRPKYILPTRGKEFTETDLSDSETFEDALKDALLQARSSNDRVFKFPEMRVIDDNTGDPNVQSLADGYEEVLNEALPKYTLQSTAGVCVVQGMVAFNGWSSSAFIVDADNVLWYILTASNGGKGFSIGQLYTDPPRFGNSSNIVTSKTRLTFGSIEEFKSGIGAIKLDFNVGDLVNVVDVTLDNREDEDASPASNDNVFYIGGKGKCDGTDIYTAYKTALANASLWKAYQSVSGAAIAVTSVSFNDSREAWVVTLNSAAISGLASGTKFKIGFQAPDVLDAAGVTGIESVDIVFTKL